MHVVVIGGGIGGLTTALALHEAGIRATVLERTREIRPLGVGINLQPHAVRELTELGFADELAAIGVPTADMVWVDRSGNPLHREERGTARGYRWPQYSVHRGELQMMLLAAVRERLGPEAVRTGTVFEHVRQNPDGVHVRAIGRETGEVTDTTGDLLVGADGLHSAVRARLHPDEGPLRWSGTMMWRGVTETDAFLTGRTMIHADAGRGARLIAYPIRPGAAGQGRSLTNWVCMVSVAEPQPLDGAAGWNRVGRLEDVLPHFTDWELGWLDVPGMLAGGGELLEYPMVDRDPLPSWGEGRVTLLGDAAHPMYPVGANGASQAIVDARVLAYELATREDPVVALRAYEDKRRAATSAIVLANRRMDRSKPRNPADADGSGDGPAQGIYTKIARTYRNSTGDDVAELNARASLHPPIRKGNTGMTFKPEPTDVTSTYYAAWKVKDFDTLRSVLAETVDFVGPYGSATSADEFRAKIEVASEINTDIVVKKVFSDGPDVLTWFEMHTSVAAPVQVATWSHVVDGKIARQRVAFDPRPITG
ncbi:FAD-dependent monooxygenase [Streptomyces sp. DSM 41634]|uniref:FAD-dependent monooxygenase n=1 Tax=Streptomyces sp. DSM 41634 TaxID=3448656 RepID=UPI0028849C13|nr:FAD-dependent monooxygenase [Streptomyces sp. DSM 41633]